MANVTIRKIDVVDVAKLVRQALKIAFPGPKFSATSSRFAGGTSIHVKWNYTRIESEVGQLIDRFQGTRYNKALDSWEPLTHRFQSDGSSVTMGLYGTSETVSNWTDPIVARVLPPDTTLVRFGADYLNCYREPTAAELAELQRRQDEARANRDPDELPF